MNEKAKNSPKQSQILVVRLTAIIVLIAFILAIGFLVKIPDDDGMERPAIIVLFERLVPPAPIQFAGESWEMLVNVDTILDDFGMTRERTYSHRIVVEMHSDGNKVYGSYVSASQTVCDNAEFAGTIDGDEISWTVTYSGTCCPTAQMEFRGTVADSRQRIDGEMSPIGIPPEDCWIWWADVTMYPQ